MLPMLPGPSPTYRSNRARIAAGSSRSAAAVGRAYSVDSRFPMGASPWPNHDSVSPGPLIEPDVRISRIRPSDWFHCKACEVSGITPATGPAPLGLVVELPRKLPDPSGVYWLMLRQSPLLCSFRSTRNQGPFPPPALPCFHSTMGPSDSRFGQARALDPSKGRRLS